MARIGVSYADVARAADEVRKEGQEPTVDRVHAYLGTGNKSTITPLLKRWQQDAPAPSRHTSSHKKGLPEDLLQAVQSVYERSQHEAELEIEKSRQCFESAQAASHEELALAQQTIEQLEGRPAFWKNSPKLT